MTAEATSSVPAEGLQLWAVVTRNTDVSRDHLKPAHREYMREIVAAGHVFASGPAAHDFSEAPFGGITVLRVADEKAARQLMDVEPFVQAGARTYELIAWDIRHGNYAQPA